MGAAAAVGEVAAGKATHDADVPKSPGDTAGEDQMTLETWQSRRYDARAPLGTFYRVAGRGAWDGPSLPRDAQVQSGGGR